MTSINVIQGLASLGMIGFGIPVLIASIKGRIRSVRRHPSPVFFGSQFCLTIFLVCAFINNEAAWFDSVRSILYLFSSVLMSFILILAYWRLYNEVKRMA